MAPMQKWAVATPHLAVDFSRFARAPPRATSPSAESAARRGDGKVGTVLRLGPDARGVACIVLDERRAQVLRSPRHVAWESVERRLLAEDLVEPSRIQFGDLPCVETAETALQLERAGERLLQRHLLEDEADEQRERLDEQAVGLVVPEMQAVGGHVAMAESPGAILHRAGASMSGTPVRCRHHSDEFGASGHTRVRIAGIGWQRIRVPTGWGLGAGGRRRALARADVRGRARRQNPPPRPLRSAVRYPA
jgi:hypothetical protein